MAQWKQDFTHVLREWISDWNKAGQIALRGNENQKGIVMSSQAATHLIIPNISTFPSTLITLDLIKLCYYSVRMEMIWKD